MIRFGGVKPKFMKHWLLSAPKSGPWYLLPIGLMVCWQAVTSTPSLGYYRETGTASQETLPVQFSTHMSSVNVTALNLAHIPGFFVLAWAWSWAFCPTNGPRNATRRALVVTGVYAVANELSQFLVPYRMPSFMDMGLNLVGVMLAVTLYGKLAKDLPREAG